MKKIFLFLILTGNLTNYLFAQIGGNSTYQFLNLPNSARVTSMGSKVNAIYDDDLSLVYQNPSLLNSQMHNHLSLNYVDYFTDIQYGYVSYAHHFEKAGNLAGGIHYINYGKFTAADVKGLKTGHFFASEYSYNLYYSHRLPDTCFTIGISIKNIFSYLEKFNSYALAADLGITYHNPEKQVTTSLILKNIGKQFYSYYEENQESLPFEIQFGISKKLEYAPFRFSIVAQQLQQLDMTYEMPEEEEELSLIDEKEEEEEKDDFMDYTDYTLRHLIFGTEMILSKNLYLRIGYNYQRRKELNYDAGFFSAVGFSWGFGIKISKFQLNFARATYHLAGSPNHFSLSTNLSEWGKNGL